MVDQVDQLIMSAVAGLEGRSQVEMVRRLLHLRDAGSRGAEASEFSAELAQARSDAMSAVDEYFKRALGEVPGIEAYLAEVAAAHS